MSLEKFISSKIENFIYVFIDDNSNYIKNHTFKENVEFLEDLIKSDFNSIFNPQLIQKTYGNKIAFDYVRPYIKQQWLILHNDKNIKDIINYKSYKYDVGYLIETMDKSFNENLLAKFISSEASKKFNINTTKKYLIEEIIKQDSVFSFEVFNQYFKRNIHLDDITDDAEYATKIGSKNIIESLSNNQYNLRYRDDYLLCLAVIHKQKELCHYFIEIGLILKKINIVFLC